jgi:hypothetical protein
MLRSIRPKRATLRALARPHGPSFRGSPPDDRAPTDFDDRAFVNLFSVSRRISADSSGSVTIRPIVSAPIIVETAARARRLPSSLSEFLARIATSL